MKCNFSFFDVFIDVVIAWLLDQWTTIYQLISINYYFKIPQKSSNTSAVMSEC